MRSITLTLTANDSFPVPFSTGYSTYAALLNKLEETATDLNTQLHDSNIATLTNSGLIGKNGEDSFGYADKQYHKLVKPDESYTLHFGIVDPDHADLFDSVVDAFVFNDDPLELTHGELTVTEFNSENTTHSELNSDQMHSNSGVRMTFTTTTGIEEVEGVTTAFPHRRAVFTSLVRHWNRTCPSGEELQLTPSDIEKYLIEKPCYTTGEDSESVMPLDTNSVVTKKIHHDNKPDQNIFLQGFTGTCEYEFKNAPDDFKNTINTLAQFAEYNGVGKAVGRGCGTTVVEVI